MTEVLYGLFNEDGFTYDAVEYAELKADSSKKRDLMQFEDDRWMALLRPIKGNTIITPQLLDSIDEVFRNVYQQDRTLLRCMGTSDTINKSALKQYRERVTKVIMTHAKDLRHPDLASLKNKIDWLFQDDMKGRRVLPLCTVSVVDALGEVLALTPEAIKEVSIVFNSSAECYVPMCAECDLPECAYRNVTV
jgi:hypothetical protein